LVYNNLLLKSKPFTRTDRKGKEFYEEQKYLTLNIYRTNALTWGKLGHEPAADLSRF
jgi:hypothetical protein